MSKNPTRLEQLGELFKAAVAVLLRGDCGLQKKPSNEPLTREEINAIGQDIARWLAEREAKICERLVLSLASGELPAIKNGSLKELAANVRIADSLAGRSLTEESDIIAAAQRLADRGAIMLSNGKVGLLMKHGGAA